MPSRRGHHREHPCWEHPSSSGFSQGWGLKERLHSQLRKASRGLGLSCSPTLPVSPAEPWGHAAFSCGRYLLCLCTYKVGHAKSV